MQDFHRNPFDGKTPHSFNDFFLRVDGMLRQVKWSMHTLHDLGDAVYTAVCVNRLHQSFSWIWLISGTHCFVGISGRSFFLMKGLLLCRVSGDNRFHIQRTSSPRRRNVVSFSFTPKHPGGGLMSPLHNIMEPYIWLINLALSRLLR